MCTSQLRQWHKNDGEKHTAWQPVTEIDVNKTKVNESRSGINNLLYAATRNTYHSESAEQEFKNQSQYGSLQMVSKQYTQANPTKQEDERRVLHILQLEENKINDIEKETRKQGESEKWKGCKFRYTPSKFHLTSTTK